MDTNRQYFKLNEDAGIHLDQVCRTRGPPGYFLGSCTNLVLITERGPQYDWIIWVLIYFPVIFISVKSRDCRIGVFNSVLLKFCNVATGFQFSKMVCSESDNKRDYFIVIREGHMWSTMPNYLTFMHSVVSCVGKALLPFYDGTYSYGFVVLWLRKWIRVLRAVVCCCTVNGTCWEYKRV
jgi:hypothetical protein